MTGFIGRLLLVVLILLVAYPFAPSYVQTIAIFIIVPSTIIMGSVLVAAWVHRRRTNLIENP